MNAGDGARQNGRYRLVLLVTTVRVPIAVLFSFFYLLTQPGGWIRAVVALLLLLSIEASDIADGAMARSLGVASELGATLDPMTDSLSRLIVFWTLAAAGDMLLLTPLVLALRDVIVSYCRIILTRAGRSVRANWSGKTKAIVQGTVACFAVLGPLLPAAWRGPYGLALSWLVILVTALSSIQYIGAARDAFGRG